MIEYGFQKVEVYVYIFLLITSILPQKMFKKFLHKPNNYVILKERTVV